MPLKRSRKSETYETVMDTDFANPSTSRVGGHELPNTPNNKKLVDDTSFDCESMGDFGPNTNNNKVLNHTFLVIMDIAMADKTWQSQMFFSKRTV